MSSLCVMVCMRLAWAQEVCSGGMDYGRCTSVPLDKCDNTHTVQQGQGFQCKAVAPNCLSQTLCVRPTCSSKQGLKAYYNAGVANVENNVWRDLTGNFDATMGGTYTAAGKTLSFKAGYATTGMTKASFKSSSDNSWTVAAWVKFTGSAGQTYSAIVGGKDSGGTEFCIGKNSGNTCLGLQDSQWEPKACSTSLFDGQYHSVIMTMNSGKGTYYVDGQNVYSASFSGVNVDEQIQIGLESEGAGYYWTGEINEVAFLDRTLSATEVQSMHQGMSSGTPFCLK